MRRRFWGDYRGASNNCIVIPYSERSYSILYLKMRLVITWPVCYLVRTERGSQLKIPACAETKHGFLRRKPVGDLTSEKAQKAISGLAAVSCLVLHGVLSHLVCDLLSCSSGYRRRQGVPQKRGVIAEAPLARLTERPFAREFPVQDVGGQKFRRITSND